MARSRIADFMQNHRFWLMDLVPSATFPYLVLGSPFLGFSSITTPEYTADIGEINELNSMYKKHVYEGGSVGTMTLTRGVRGFDDTMWNWMHSAIKGNDTTYRDLLLIQYTSINPSSVAGEIVGALVDPLSLAEELPGDAWEGRGFIPGKAWILFGCIPTRYKPASDFDAMGGQVSVAELDIQPTSFIEISLLSPL